MEHRITRPTHAARTGLLLLACTLLSACMHVPELAQRQQTAAQLAAARGWQAQLLDTGPFVLLSYQPPVARPSRELTVYIEGDGLAWLSRDTPSSDPTPLDPLALRLALAQTEGTAVYLARPCQYTGLQARGCTPRHWQAARFAPEVLQATLLALDQLKQQHQAQQLRLVGYSGGATVAALAAAQRQDVSLLLTVAGNLDLQAWTTHHRVSPLDGSLDPARDRAAQARIRQRHYAGGRDTVVPPALLQGYVHGLPAGTDVQLIVEPTYDHRCCWADHWAQRLGAATAIGR